MKKLFLIIIPLVIYIVLIFTRTTWIVNPNREIFPVRGIDVSHHQGNIEWELVSKDDVGFAYIKATEANDLKDELFTHNLENANKHNISTGAYHFYSLGYPGQEQAKNFIETVQKTLQHSHQL